MFILILKFSIDIDCAWTGYRMSAPEGTPEEIYRLMLQCWEYKPENRPHFTEIYNIVNNLCIKLFDE